MPTSICRSIVTICSGLYLLMGMTRFSSKWILSHSTRYKFRRSRHLGGMPAVEAKTVRTSEKATEMLQFDLENETETIRNYRERVRQCEELGEYAMSEQIREILIDEQDHQIALATALGKSVPQQHKAA